MSIPVEVLSKARSRQMRRTMLLIALLRSHGGNTLNRLAESCGVTPRTIRRDLQMLEAAGLPVYRSEDDSAGFWRLVKGTPCPVCSARVGRHS